MGEDTPVIEGSAVIQQAEEVNVSGRGGLLQHDNPRRVVTRRNRRRTIGRKFVLLILSLALIGTVVVPGVALGWTNYYSGVMKSAMPVNYAETGWNYWVNNRVYRPTGNTFRLWYRNNNGSWYVQNKWSNPVYFTANHGYSRIACDYVYFLDGAPAGYEVNPVTCQGDT